MTDGKRIELDESQLDQLDVLLSQLIPKLSRSKFKAVYVSQPTNNGHLQIEWQTRAEPEPAA